MTLLPDRHNFTVWRGGTFRTRLTLYTDAGITPRDLTGYTARLVCENPDTDEILLNLTTGNGGIEIDGLLGTIDLYISDEATQAITWNVGQYELKITSPSGDTDPLLYGSIVVKGSV
jgi:hypothetical protein